MATDAPDGTLLRWEDVKDEQDWKVLLLGNGMSINVWEPFGYERLLDEGANSQLTPEDVALFDGTPNFERVLADLNTAIRVCDVAGVPTDPLYARYRSIQAALGHAVRQVHLTRSRVPDATLAGIREVMLQFEWIFTTSYDLLLYWAMGYDGYWPFVDLFGGQGYTFEVPDAIHPDVIPVLYLHGALHLVVSGKGVTSKRTRDNMRTLLDQFGQPIAGDPQARPLLVTEGSARDKRRAVEGNSYLSSLLGALASPQVALPTVVFGSKLSVEDDHLVEALSEHPRPVAISMLKKPKKQLMAAQVDIWGRLNASDIYFYDASTNPLGSPSLRVSVT
jgi:hypothetical protein